MRSKGKSRIKRSKVSRKRTQRKTKGAKRSNNDLKKFKKLENKLEKLHMNNASNKEIDETSKHLADLLKKIKKSRVNKGKKSRVKTKGSKRKKKITKRKLQRGGTVYRDLVESPLQRPEAAETFAAPSALQASIVDDDDDDDYDDDDDDDDEEWWEAKAAVARETQALEARRQAARELEEAKAAVAWAREARDRAAGELDRDERAEEEAQFSVDDVVERRDEGEEWGKGYVRSLEPLTVSFNLDEGEGDDTDGYEWDQVRAVSAAGAAGRAADTAVWKLETEARPVAAERPAHLDAATADEFSDDRAMSSTGGTGGAPDGWETHMSPTSGETYYHNPLTEQSIYERPSPAISFEIVKKISGGSWGSVFKVKKEYESDRGAHYAMKVLDKYRGERALDEFSIEHIIAERNILQEITREKVPFVVRMHYAFQDQDRLYLVLDYLRPRKVEDGRDLNEILVSTGSFAIEDIQLFTPQIVLALEGLHQLGIVHRDLKPANIVLDRFGGANLVDFGLSLKVESTLTATSGMKNMGQAGTYEYRAPEETHPASVPTDNGNAVDWWALGVILYECYFGRRPFDYPDTGRELVDRETLYDNIRRTNIVFPLWADERITSLITELLKKDPKERLTDPQMIKEHPFFEGIDWGEEMEEGIQVVSPTAIVEDDDYEEQEEDDDYEEEEEEDTAGMRVGMRVSMWGCRSGCVRDAWKEDRKLSWADDGYAEFSDFILQ